MPDAAAPSGPTSPVTSSTRVTQPTSKTLFANYAEYVQQVLLAERVGSIATIPNPLARGDQPVLPVDPEIIHAYRQSIADQMNAASNGPIFEDLSERIADIVVETSAQGASTLEVHLIDPAFIIPMSGFISVDETGYLWPPIDVVFPSGTDCEWRLVQYAPTWGTSSDANLVLTFEDKIVSQLREISAANGGVQQGSPNQTLGGFFKQLIDSANNTLHTKIRLVELISPQDPNYTLPVTSIPSSATAKSKLRTNPHKTKRGLTPIQEASIAEADRIQRELHIATSSGSTTIAAAEAHVGPTYSYPAAH